MAGKNKRTVYLRPTRSGDEVATQRNALSNAARPIPTPKERQARDLRQAKPRRNDPRTWDH